ncbi:MAG TPA: hypothetical protein ENI51_07840 [Candidatus Atribacteria bacterium]|nr:hypothetical protein [Candidatus Atribacteria bacterium]
MKIIKKFKIKFSKKGKRYTKFILLCLSLSFIFTILQMQNGYGAESEIYSLPVNISPNTFVLEKGISDNNYVYSFSPNETIIDYPHLEIKQSNLEPKPQVCSQFLYQLPSTSNFSYWYNKTDEINYNFKNKKIAVVEYFNNAPFNFDGNWITDYGKWIDLDGSGCQSYFLNTTKTGDGGESFKDFLYQYDGSGSSAKERLKLKYPIKTHGNFTYYFLMDKALRINVGLYGNSTGSVKLITSIIIKYDTFYRYDVNHPLNELAKYQYDRWYKGVFHFSFDNSGYKGLNQYEWKYEYIRLYDNYQDETNVYTFLNSVDNLTHIEFSTGGGLSGNKDYFDNITIKSDIDNIENNTHYFNYSLKYDDYEKIYVDYLIENNVSVSTLNIYNGTKYIPITSGTSGLNFSNFIFNNSFYFMLNQSNSVSQESDVSVFIRYSYYDEFDVSYHKIKEVLYEYTVQNPSSLTDNLDGRTEIETVFNRTGLIEYKITHYRWTGSGWLMGSTLINYGNITSEKIKNIEFDTQIVYLDYNSTHKNRVIRTKMILNQNESQSFTLINNTYVYDTDVNYYYIYKIELSGRYLYRHDRYFDNVNFDLLKARFLYVNFRDYLAYFPMITNYKYDIDLELNPPDEPEPPSEPNPVTSNYWTYQSFRIVESNKIEVVFDDYIDFYNDTQYIKVNYNFTQIKGEGYTAKFYYDKSAIKELRASNLGDWGINNWLRDLLCNLANVFITILNAILLFLQFLLFCVVVAFNYLIMFLVMMIILPFLWNIIVYWIIYALAYLWFLIYSGLVYALGLIITFFSWLYLNVLLPFFDWLLNDFLPLLLALFIALWAFIIAVVLTILSGENIGSDFYNKIYANIYEALSNIMDFLLNTIWVAIENFDAVIYCVFLYITFIGFAYLKYWYDKAKGFVGKAEERYASLEAYLLPITIAMKLYDRIKNSIPAA